MADPALRTRARQEVEAALALLDHPAAGKRRGGSNLAAAAALPGLLDQLRTRADPGKPVMRTVHHLACTGGTRISRGIAAMPNTSVLSEVDPLSPMFPRSSFNPTDLISLSRQGRQPVENAKLVQIFLAGLRVLHDQYRAQGRMLVLRDHSHSHFSYGETIPDRPDMREMLGADFHVLPLVSVRHPLDSLLSLIENGWFRLSPATLEEYARRYLVFLEHYKDVDILRYEDFVKSPESRMRQACEQLDLPYSADFETIFPVITLSGDSGRKSNVIRMRPRRDVPSDIAAQAAESGSYQILCDQLGYDPVIG